MDKKAHIIKVATLLFQQKGYMSVGLNELLLACHCSRGAFYHHFPLGKEQLLLQCLDHIRHFIAEDCYRIFSQQDTVIQGVKILVQQLVHDYHANGTIVGYTFTSIVSEMGAVSEEVRKACASLYDELTTIIGRQLEREGLSKNEALDKALFIVTTIEGAVMLTLTKRDTLPLDIIAKQLEQNI